MILDDLKQRFIWTADGKLDKWNILSNPDGPLLGDCDDWAITAAYLLARSSLTRMWFDIVTLKSVFWVCKTDNGYYHIVLYRRGSGWIDNIFPSFREKPIHKLKFPMPFPFVAFMLLLGKLR